MREDLEGHPLYPSVAVDLEQHYYATPTFDATMKSFMRYSQKPVPEPFTAEELEAGWRMLDYVYGHLYSTAEQRPFYTACDAIVVDSSPGRLWKMAGVKNKLDAYASARPMLQEFFEHAAENDYPVVWSVSGKYEMLPQSKFDANKVRTFVVAPIEFYILQESVLGDMVDKVKAVGGHCDGEPCLWFGGMNEIAEDLNRFPHKSTSDIEGMDRDFPLILMEILEEFCMKMMKDKSERTRQRVQYICKQVAHSLCLLPDGTVWMKDGGNPSGHKGTTVWNFIAHCFVIGIRVWRHFKCTPQEMPGTFHIFSDDNVESWTRPLSFEERDAIYRRCGWGLKREDDVMSKRVDGLKFLGFYFSFQNGRYEPLFDRVRLFNSIIRSSSNKLEHQPERLLGLLVVSIFDEPVSRIVYDLYQDVCQRLNVQPAVRELRALRQMMAGKENWLLQASRFVSPANLAFAAIPAIVEGVADVIGVAEEVANAVGLVHETNETIKHAARRVQTTHAQAKQVVKDVSSLTAPMGRKRAKSKAIAKTVANTSREAKKATRLAAQSEAMLARSRAAGHKVKLSRKATMAPAHIGHSNFRSTFQPRVSANGEQMTVKVTDRLVTLVAPANGEVGEVIYRLPLNPASFESTRLAQEATLWDQFKLESITFSYEPDCGTQTDGSVILAFDPDVKDDASYPVGETTDLRALTANSYHRQVSVWDRCSVTYHRRENTWLYVRPGNNEAYWAQPGIFVVAMNTVRDSEKSIGTLYYNCTYTFKGRTVGSQFGEYGAYTFQVTGATPSSQFAGASNLKAILDDQGEDNNTIAAPIIMDTFVQFSGLLSGPNAESPATYLVTFLGSPYVNNTATGGDVGVSGSSTRLGAYGSNAGGIFGGFANPCIQVSGMFQANNGGLLAVRPTWTSGAWTTAPTFWRVIIQRVPNISGVYYNASFDPMVMRNHRWTSSLSSRHARDQIPSPMQQICPTTDALTNTLFTANMRAKVRELDEDVLQKVATLKPCQYEQLLERVHSAAYADGLDIAKIASKNMTPNEMESVIDALIAEFLSLKKTE